jgi:two-component system KDP operon response regulator KdpE
VVDDLVFHPTGSVCRAGVPVDLSPTERRVLATLAAHPDAPVTKQELIQAAWGTVTSSSSAYLALYMSNLRQKIEVNPGTPRYLRAVKGGYAFSTAAASVR